MTKGDGVGSLVALCLGSTTKFTKLPAEKLLSSSVKLLEIIRRLN